MVKDCVDVVLPGIVSAMTAPLYIFSRLIAVNASIGVETANRRAAQRNSTEGMPESWLRLSPIWGNVAKLS
jgi:hypothetical protein